MIYQDLETNTFSCGENPELEHGSSCNYSCWWEPLLNDDHKIKKFWACYLCPPALIPSNLLAILSCVRLAVGSAFHLTFECVCHPCICCWLWLIIPDLLAITAFNVWNNKLDIFSNQLALLPGHWVTGISPSPHLGR